MKWTNATDETAVLVSHSSYELVRPVSFRFALDPNREQAGRFSMFAGARRFAFNHHVGRVKANLEQRTKEREAGVASGEMTPSLSWSAQSFINEFNAWKNGQADDSPTVEATPTRRPCPSRRVGGGYRSTAWPPPSITSAALQKTAIRRRSGSIWA